GRSLWKKVGAGANGKANIPHLVRAEADPAAVGRIAKAHLRCVPVFRMGSEGGVFQLDGVVKLVDCTSESDAAGIAWTPDDGKAQIFVRIVHVVVGWNVCPIKQLIDVVWCGDVPDTGKVFIW